MHGVVIFNGKEWSDRRIAFDQVSNVIPIGAKPELLLNAGSTSAELYKTDLPNMAALSTPMNSGEDFLYDVNPLLMIVFLEKL
jgi:hypothetical protein